MCPHTFREVLDGHPTFDARGRTALLGHGAVRDRVEAVLTTGGYERPRHSSGARHARPSEERSAGTGRYAVVPDDARRPAAVDRDPAMRGRRGADEQPWPPRGRSRSDTGRNARSDPASPDGPTSDDVVRAEELVKVYGRAQGAVHALDGVSVSVERGRFTAIMGPSGSGKSTLMHCLAGLDRPTSGRVMLGPTDLTRLSERKLTRLRRDRIGVVFQDYNLLPQLTVRQNIVLPLEIAGRRLERPWLDTVLDVLDLGPLLRQRPEQLSGGEQQRMAVARALLPRPDVVFADEPTGALDAGTAREMLMFLRSSVQELGQTVVMVTHDPLAAQHTDRVLMLHGGRLAGQLIAPTAHAVLDVLAMLDEEAVAQAMPRRHGSAAGPSEVADPRYDTGRRAVRPR